MKIVFMFISLCMAMVLKDAAACIFGGITVILLILTLLNQFQWLKELNQSQQSDKHN